MAKYKDRKTNAPLLLFGDAVEADAASRLATKYTWEGDILASPDALVSHPERGTLSDEWGRKKLTLCGQEAGLDFAFLRMGISMEAVAHPVVMSERLATPLASRACTSLNIPTLGVTTPSSCRPAALRSLTITLNLPRFFSIYWVGVPIQTYRLPCSVL